MLSDRCRAELLDKLPIYYPGSVCLIGSDRKYRWYLFRSWVENLFTERACPSDSGETVPCYV